MRYTTDGTNQLARIIVITRTFEARQFSQNVALSEVVALIQNVPGVESVRLACLSKSADEVSSRQQPEPILFAVRPRAGAALESVKKQPAEILVLDGVSLKNLKVKAQ